MHTLWVREHNRVATALKQRHPNYNEEKLYQESRKIVIAEWQQVVYSEWLPRTVSLPSYSGYNEGLDARIINAFSTAAFRFGHSLVPNAFGQLNNNFDKSHPDISLQASFNDIRSINQRGIEPTVLGLVGNLSNIVDTDFAEGLARKLFLRPGESGHVDLTALNIQRGRDHGLPTYGRWRSFCRLPAISSFSQLENFMNPSVAQDFATIYNSPNDIDLFAAGIAENPVSGFQIGPTFQCIFREQFTRLRAGDRYFYLNPGVFTTAQRSELQKVTMSRILCDNVKGIVSVNRDAFVQTRNSRTSCGAISGINFDLF